MSKEIYLGKVMSKKKIKKNKYKEKEAYKINLDDTNNMAIVGGPRSGKIVQAIIRGKEQIRTIILLNSKKDYSLSLKELVNKNEIKTYTLGN